MKFTRDEFERFNAFIEKCAQLPNKFIDTNLIIAILFIQLLLIGVCTFYLKNLIYQTLIPPATLELIK